jgi:hypothetical protein
MRVGGIAGGHVMAAIAAGNRLEATCNIVAAGAIRIGPIAGRDIGAAAAEGFGG